MLLLLANVLAEHVMTKQYAMHTEPLTASYRIGSAGAFFQTVSDAKFIMDRGLVISVLQLCSAASDAKIRQTAELAKTRTVICRLQVNALFAETEQHRSKKVMVIIIATQV